MKTRIPHPSLVALASGASAKETPTPQHRTEDNPASDALFMPQTYGYMRQKELIKIVPFSPATLWRMVKSGKFVRPIKLSDRITAWSRAEVYAWLQKQEGPQ